jgi:hypothetical protein
VLDPRTIHLIHSFVYSFHRSIHWYRNHHIIKAIYIIYNIYTSSVNIHKTPVKIVTQSLWVNNIILYFSVCKSIPGQEPLRYRTCHDRKQVCIQYTDQTHTFMINHTGQQKHPYKLHRQCKRGKSRKGNCTYVKKKLTVAINILTKPSLQQIKVQGARVCKRYTIYNRMHKDNNHWEVNW